MVKLFRFYPLWSNSSHQCQLIGGNFKSTYTATRNFKTVPVSSVGKRYNSRDTLEGMLGKCGWVFWFSHNLRQSIQEFIKITFKYKFYGSKSSLNFWIYVKLSKPTHLMMRFTKSILLVWNNVQFHQGSPFSSQVIIFSVVSNFTGEVDWCIGVFFYFTNAYSEILLNTIL